MLTAADIAIGKTYRGKRPKQTLFGGYDDRTVLWIDTNRTRLQYDSVTVAIGRRCPIIDMDKFLRWAQREACR